MAGAHYCALDHLLPPRGWGSTSGPCAVEASTQAADFAVGRFTDIDSGDIASSGAQRCTQNEGSEIG